MFGAARGFGQQHCHCGSSTCDMAKIYVLKPLIDPSLAGLPESVAAGQGGADRVCLLNGQTVEYPRPSASVWQHLVRPFSSFRLSTTLLSVNKPLQQRHDSSTSAGFSDSTSLRHQVGLAYASSISDETVFSTIFTYWTHQSTPSSQLRARVAGARSQHRTKSAFQPSF